MPTAAVATILPAPTSTRDTGRIRGTEDPPKDIERHPAPASSHRSKRKAAKDQPRASSRSRLRVTSESVQSSSSTRPKSTSEETPPTLELTNETDEHFDTSQSNNGRITAPSGASKNSQRELAKKSETSGVASSSSSREAARSQSKRSRSTHSTERSSSRPRDGISTSGGTVPSQSVPAAQRSLDSNGANGRKTGNVTQITSNIAADISSTLQKQASALKRPIDMPANAGGLPRSTSDNSFASSQGSTELQTRASPPSKLSSLFGWRVSPRLGSETPSTIHTGNVASSPPPPLKPPNVTLDRSPPAPALQRTLTNDSRLLDFQSFSSGSPRVPFSMQSIGSGSHIEELERELMEVSIELANSIKREMELEDELERYKSEPNFHGDGTKRTSDYYSDSGSSFAKYGGTDGDNKIDQLERARRKLEQEKGQMRAEFSTKLADEYKRRKDTESQLATLQKQPIRTSSPPSADTTALTNKLQVLENALEEASRKLSQERESKDNFEDLLAALRAENTELRQERDNLLEEVIPPLRVRVEGLEQENARIHQEFGYPSQKVEEVAPQPAQDNIDLKDIEEQRNALQSTLKSLIRRNEAEKREHSRVIQRLTAERDAAISSLGGTSPSSRGIAILRDDVAFLRTRANDALKHKWQCEDNLGGAKGSLDRAQQKTKAVRASINPQDARTRNLRAGLSVDTDRYSMIKVLRRSAQLAESERDAARSEAAMYRDKAAEMPDSSLARELLASATRLEEYSAMLDASLEQTIELSEQLASAIEEGEEEQAESAARIVDMQSKLGELEYSVRIARQATEADLANHEETLSMLKANERPQISRLSIKIPDSNHGKHRKGSALYWVRSPQKTGNRPPVQDASRTRSHHAKSHHHRHTKSKSTSSRTSEFEEKVTNLEKAVAQVDGAVGDVVTNVERSSKRIEELKQARDKSDSGIKKIQKSITDEKKRTDRLLR